MTDAQLQKEFFEQIKTSLPPHISLVEEMTQLLNISYDSVYRRLRGEKPLPLHELKILCSHFKVSLDQLLQLHYNAVIFTDTEADNVFVNFEQYLQDMLQELQHFNAHTTKQLFYLSKDVPVFYFYYFKELAAFKSFFWAKSILNEPALQTQQFSLKKFDAAPYFNLGQKILKEYNQIPSAEIWNYESISSTVLQLEYYRDAGVFETDEDLNKVADSCDAMLVHLQQQLEKGRKFLPGTGEAGYGAPLQFYINEIILGNNSILVQVDNKKMAFINHIVLKYISTTDERFTTKAFNNFQNLVSRSVLISGTGEKERNKFFNVLRNKVKACKR
jgi:hypothetical protein